MTSPVMTSLVMASRPSCDRRPSRSGVIQQALLRQSGWRRPGLLRLLGLGVFSVLVGAALGCSGDTANGPAATLSPEQAYWALQFTQHAVIVPLNDTVRITAIPINAAGVALAGHGGVVTYTPADSSVTVSASGLVTARYVTPGLGTQVVATLQDPRQRLTHKDTVTIQVTSVPGALHSYQLRPAPGDSAKRAVDFTDDFTSSPSQFSWAVRATDVNDDSVCTTSACTIPVYYTSSNPTIADINHTTGLVSTFDTGRVVFKASTLVDGTVMQDSVAFTIGYALNEMLLILPTTDASGRPRGAPMLFSVPPQVVMGVGAIVTFSNRTITPVDILFDDPTNVDSSSSYFGTTFLFGDPTGTGNIPAFGGIYSINNNTQPPDTEPSIFNPGNYAARSFPVAGSYHLHSTLFPTVALTLTIRQETF